MSLQNDLTDARYQPGPTSALLCQHHIYLVTEPELTIAFLLLDFTEIYRLI